MNKQKHGISLQNVQWWGPSPVVPWLGLCFRCGGMSPSPVVPWLGLCASAAGGTSPFLVGELRSRLQSSQCTPPAMRLTEPAEVQLCFKNEFMTLLASS